MRILLVALLGLTSANNARGQALAPVATDREILNELLPHGQLGPEGPPNLRGLKRFRRVDEIRALKAAQANPKDEAIAIAGLLAVLKYHYAKNRSRLIKLERNCRLFTDEIQIDDCHEQIAYVFMILIERGDRPLLGILFDIQPQTEFLTDLLGQLFSDLLDSQPRVFLWALARRPINQQKDISSLTGSEQGDGMDPQRLSEVRRILRHIIINHNDPLSKVARICLRQINIENRPDNNHKQVASRLNLTI